MVFRVLHLSPKCAKTDAMEELLSVTAAATELGVTVSTIYRWIHGGALSIRYFPDGRQAIVKQELEDLAQSGENAALAQIFLGVAELLGKAVALLPAVERAFQKGWETHVLSAAKWEGIRVMAIKQSEAHRDIAPFVRHRGRPSSAMERLRASRRVAFSRLNPKAGES